MEEAMQVKPFAFKRRFERVDWRKLASVNLDQIARDLDFVALQDNLSNIAFCNIELELDLRLIDPNFVKLFRLAQLTIEYLLYSQEYLSETIVALEGRVTEQNKNEENLNEKLRITEKELERMKKEGHKRKKLLMDQQHLIESGADNFHKCLLCPKAFMNATFLQNHCVRRHGQTFQEIKGGQEEKKESEIPDKISEQLQEIKERLIFTESQLAEERKSIKEINSRESSLLAERDAEHLKRLEQWQEVREAEHKQEIERIQNILMIELREMQEKQTATQQALEAAQQGQLRPSNLGSVIRDEIDVEREMLQKEREEVMRLKEQIKLQMDSMQEMARHAGGQAEVRENAEHQMELKKLQRALREKEDEVTLLKERPVEVKVTDKKVKKKTSSPIKREASAPLSNGHAPIEDKKKKTLTFAAELDVATPSRGKQSFESEVQELPPTDSTLSSEGDSNTYMDEDTTLNTNQSLSTLGTLDITGNSRQLRELLLQNPRLLADMKVQLQQKVNDELMRWDVQPESEGLTDTKFATKQSHLSQERSKMERKYKKFREMRETLIKEVDEKAKQEAEAAKQKPLPGKGQSPKDSRRLGGTLSSMTGTMESSTWGTSSSKWTSSDRRDQMPDLSTDEESESEETPHQASTPKSSRTNESPQHIARVPAAPQPRVPPRDSQSETTRASSGWTHDDVEDGGFAPRPAARDKAIKMPGVDVEESDWDEDDLSELAEIGEGTRTVPTFASSGGSTATNRARGVVGEIAASIENQLLGRKGKAPAGGVNTLRLPPGERDGASSPITPDIPKVEASDDDFSISSAEAPHGTYGSRTWGQGSATNSLSITGRRGSGDKANSITSDNASLTSVTGTGQKGDSGSDWSADSDFGNL